jgi:hypothetical protein
MVAKTEIHYEYQIVLDVFSAIKCVNARLSVKIVICIEPLSV